MFSLTYQIGTNSKADNTFSHILLVGMENMINSKENIILYNNELCEEYLCVHKIQILIIKLNKIVIYWKYKGKGMEKRK